MWGMGSGPTSPDTTNDQRNRSYMKVASGPITTAEATRAQRGPGRRVGRSASLDQRSSRRRILPEALFGMASITSSTRICL